MRRKEITVISMVLLLVSGLAWGVYGIFDINLIGTLFSFSPLLAQCIYMLFGLSSLYTLWRWIRDYYSERG